MKISVYSVRDKVADIFMQPFNASNDNVAIRDFASAGKNGSVPHFVDYELFKLGEFDSHTGELLPQNPVRIASGDSLKVGDSIED